MGKALGKSYKACNAFEAMDFIVNMIFIEKYVGKLCAYSKHIGRN